MSGRSAGRLVSSMIAAGLPVLEGLTLTARTVSNRALRAATETMADAVREGGYVRRLPEDPWGQPYQYRRPSTHGGQFDVFSLGADGREGGEGNDADLGNWQA